MTEIQLTDKITVINGDCMEVMSHYPDKHFDLAVVDPPYGIGISLNPVRQMHKRKKWDSEIPQSEYFRELMRVSVDQIVWGGNYFPLPPTQGFLIWDKVQPMDFSLAMCELAWTSIQSPAKMFKRSVLAERDKIHPTQKPVSLYGWIFKNYAKSGFRILDTHGGSMSSVIAADKAGLEMVCVELDKDYFDKAVDRFRKYKSQMKLEL